MGDMVKRQFKYLLGEALSNSNIVDDLNDREEWA
jgi:hypothetical protein